jgi:hypothetical protein
VDNIEMNLKEIQWEDVDWIFLDRDQCLAPVNTFMIFIFHKAWNLSSSANVIFSKRVVVHGVTE